MRLQMSIRLVLPLLLVAVAQAQELTCAALTCLANPPENEEFQVCGTDGVTYSNVCAAVCDGGVQPAHPGPCIVNPPLTCAALTCLANPGESERFQVCGTDGVTYRDVCAAVCDGGVQPAYPGPCLLLPCPEFCPTGYLPLCGSDGVTYSNLCFLQQTACLSRTLITVAHEGECGASELLDEHEDEDEPEKDKPYLLDDGEKDSTKPPKPICPLRCPHDYVCTINTKCDSTSPVACEPYVCKPLPCAQPPFYEGDSGVVCQAAIPAWSFNATASECQAWIYGGCGANDNIFFTENDCVDACVP